MNEKRFEILDKTRCHDGYFALDRYRIRHSLFGGGWSGERVFELFERGRAAAVLPYDPVRDEVVLIEQFRIGALEAAGGPWLVEIVAGIIEAGETPEAVVRREMQEEAGCAVGDLIPICTYLATPGACTETIAVFAGAWTRRGRTASTALTMKARTFG